ncbi:unnamed protein product [Anisakis simplex]|uniref:Uncharacterized protein n=1 Tax=Anisakis simplex TaxID=6269 RepID=A0A3P6RLP6_ANISI|nr:unnamed protein product [Anisakis simplex]
MISTNDISPKSQSSIVGTGIGASSVTGGSVAGASAPGVCVQKPKETSAQRRARRLRNRKSERETDGGDERLLNMTGTAANASLTNNAADELLMNLSMDLNLNLSTIIPTETQFHLQLSPQTSHINTNSLLIDQTPFSPRGDEPMIQLCEAWSNFKLDVSRLFVEVA